MDVLMYAFNVKNGTQFLSTSFFVFLKKILVDTWPFMGPLIPLFWTSGDIFFGLQSQSGQPYLHMAEAYMMYIP